MSELTKLVSHYLKEHGISRNKLAHLCGYKNISKGLRVIDSYLNDLNEKNNISTKIINNLNIPVDEFNAAKKSVKDRYEQQAENLKENTRQKFKAFAQVICSSRPSPVFVAAMIPKLWHFPIPDLKNCNIEQEKQLLFEAYQKHQLDLSKGPHNLGSHKINNYDDLVQTLDRMDAKNKHYPWVFGKGFRYFRNYDETIVFNRYGEVVEQHKSHVEPNRAVVSVSGKEIPTDSISKSKGNKNGYS
ncbi:MAG: hypothetical protein HQL46_16770 [Gammaproteobacteria bacterium]|nr:hypothetical protein [Gammaproteobacteria bacterium]